MRNVVSNLIVALVVVLLSPALVAGDMSRPTSELCSPAKINLGDLLTIRIPDPSLVEMAVSDPLGRWFYLQGSDVIQPLLDERQFAEAEKITLDTSTLGGTLYEDGRRVQSLVFTMPGQYTVSLADNLETEPENAFSFECQVIVTKPDGE